jgi:hypothetical protein
MHEDVTDCEEIEVTLGKMRDEPATATVRILRMEPFSESESCRNTL